MRIGIYAGLTLAVISLGSLFLQACRTERNAGEPAKTENLAPTAPAKPAAAVPPAPIADAQPEAVPETNWIQPDSTNLPDNVTLARAAVRPAAPSRAVTPPKTISRNHPVRMATTSYVVRSGDTLARIARNHGTTVPVLQALNHLAGDRIHVGERLRIPAAVPDRVRLVRQ